MDENHYQILEFLSKQTTPIKMDNFPQAIKSQFDSYSIKPGSLHHELEIVLKNKGWVAEAKNVNNQYIITPYGQEVLSKERTGRMEILGDGQIKHNILKFLKIDKARSYELHEIEEEFPINKDRLIYLLDEMYQERNIEMKDISSKGGADYLIFIVNKGIGTYAKSEYLKAVIPVGSPKPSDFSSQDIEKMNNTINDLLGELEILKAGQEVIWTDIMEELNELKELYFLKKKNWRQLLTGKVAEMVASGMVDQTISKHIVDAINPIISNLIGN